MESYYDVTIVKRVGKPSIDAEVKRRDASVVDNGAKVIFSTVGRIRGFESPTASGENTVRSL